MAKKIYGLSTMAKIAGVTQNAIYWLIEKGKIHPKKERIGKFDMYAFDEKDQREIRMHTSMRE